MKEILIFYTNSFYKGSESKHFRLCGPYGVVAIIHCSKSSRRQYGNEMGWLCSIKFYLQNRQWARFNLWPMGLLTPALSSKKKKEETVTVLNKTHIYIKVTDNVSH